MNFKINLSDLYSENHQFIYFLLILFIYFIIILIIIIYLFTLFCLWINCDEILVIRKSDEILD